MSRWSDSDVITLQSITLPSVATIGKVEEAIEQFFRVKQRVPEYLQLDLSLCDYIEVSTLVYLIAIIGGRHTQGGRTVLRLPQSEERKSVRDILRAWEFPKAVREAVGIPFIELVHPDDRCYFGENGGETKNKYGGRFIEDPDLGESRLRSDRFFAITTFRPTLSVEASRVVMEQSNRWEDVLVKAVLAKHLGGPENYFASRIVFESMYNAFRHSGASIVQTASRFDWNANHFTIVFWDNGESIVETLRRPLSQGKTVQCRQFAPIGARYSVVEKDESGHTAREEEITTDFVPPVDCSDGMLLLAATLPGITSDVDGKRHEVHDELRKASPYLTSPGMGLYVMTNAAIDLYGGTVSFRTKRSFLNIKTGSHSKNSSASYRAKIRRFGNWLPEFQGNMVTIRLPLRDGKSF